MSCFRSVVESDIKVGSVITVNHSGFFQNGTLRNPYFVRKRLSSKWKQISPANRTLVQPQDSYINQEPLAFWHKRENQLNFFNRLKDKLGINSMDGLYSLSPEVVKQHGAKALLEVLFNGSLATALQTIYPSHRFLPWRFQQNVPHGYWNSKENQRTALKQLEGHFNISEPRGWYDISWARVNSTKEGRALLSKHRNSLSNVLQAVYPTHQWDTKRVRESV